MSVSQAPHEPCKAGARHLVLAMAVVQVIWIAAIWHTGTARHSEKLPILLAYSLACAFMAWYPRNAPSSRLKRIKALVQEKEALLTRLFLVALMAVCGIYAYLQMGWPDEKAIFFTSRTIPEQGVAAFFDQYGKLPWIGKQHPPLVPLLYGFAMSVFGVHVMVPRLVSLMLTLGVVVLTFGIARDLYGRRIALWSAAFFSSAPFFFRVGATGLSDMPMTFFFILAVFLFLRLLQRPTYLLAGAAGLCIGAGLLCRYPMALIFPLLLGFAILRGSFVRLLPHLALLTLVSGALLAAWFAFASQLGVVEAQAEMLTEHAVFAARSASRGNWGWFLISLLFRMPSGLGVANLPVLLLGLAVLVKRRNRSDLLIIVWVAAVFLPLVLTLPGPRFFLPAFPALAIAMACGVERLSGGQTRVVVLALLYAAGAMYLFVDWYQAAGALINR